MIKNGLVYLSNELQVDKNYQLTDFIDSELSRIAIITTRNPQIGSVEVRIPTVFTVSGLECKIKVYFIKNKINLIVLSNPSYESALFELDTNVVYRDEDTFFHQCQEMLFTVFSKHPPFIVDNIYVHLEQDIHSGTYSVGFVFFDYLEFLRTGVYRPYTGRRS